jgi:VWFA-related protein
MQGTIRSLAALVAAVVAFTAVQAQQPTFKTGASLVRVDVTVVDRTGEPVTSLGADDFEVQEDGVAQTVATCTLGAADGHRKAGEDESLGIRSPEHAAAEAAREDVRVFLIFWDEYHIDKFVPAIRAREALTEFVTHAFGPTDLIALMDPLLPVDALRFTRDRSELLQKIRKLTGRFGEYVPVRSAAEEAMLEHGDVGRLRSEVTISALKAAAVHLGSLKQGRKAIVFVSEGLTRLDHDGPQLLEDLVRAANNNNTAIYSLDPRGLIGRVSDALRLLSDNTGAHAIVNTNAPARALRQVVSDASAFYLVGYTSTRSPADDGRFHQIKVRVKRPGTDVRARKGYWAPSLTDVERAAKESSAAALPADVSQALAVVQAARPDRALDVWVGFSRAADGRSDVTVAWTPRAAPSTARGRLATFSVSVPGETGLRVFEAPIETRRVSFRAAPGALRMRLTARDADGDVLDDSVRSVEVPDLGRGDLAIGSPVVLRAQTAVELRGLTAAADPVPFAGREFVRTDRLLVRFALYGDAAGRATVSARLINAASSTLVTLPATPVDGQPGVFQIDLPLAAVARGDFLIAIEAADADARAAAMVPVRVGS